LQKSFLYDENETHLTLAEFGEQPQQLGKTFEHEARLKELLEKQAALNAALDLDKGEQQIAPPAEVNGESGSDERSDAAAPRPRYEARRRREYDTADHDVADDEAVMEKRRGPVMGPGL
jgi:hypothetical protein